MTSEHPYGRPDVMSQQSPQAFGPVDCTTSNDHRVDPDAAGRCGASPSAAGGP